jgi:sensor c-di-GMP phosphodiesterase-like protein
VPEQLETGDYLRHLQGLIALHGVSPNQVSVEITERRQFEDMAAGRQVLQAMVQAGFEVKLDDAGTGFGGFSYVQELPIGTLKIDKMFVDTLRTGQDAKRPVLDAIVEFARISGLKTIAEGVETEDQVRQLAALGVHAIQGYVFGKPMPFAAFQAWAARREAPAQNG